MIARYRSQVRTIAFILSGELITKPLDVHFELVCDYVFCSGGVIFCVVPRPRIGSSVRQLLGYAEPLGNKRPVLVEAFEFPDEIGEHISVGIDEPIQLGAMRGRVDAGAAAILDPIDKSLEIHFVSEL